MEDGVDWSSRAIRNVSVANALFVDGLHPWTADTSVFADPLMYPDWFGGSLEVSNNVIRKKGKGDKEEFKVSTKEGLVEDIEGAVSGDYNGGMSFKRSSPLVVRRTNIRFAGYDKTATLLSNSQVCFLPLSCPLL